MDNGECAAALVRNALGSAGYEIVQAADGSTALEKARADRPDLIVVDIFMPRHPGLYILRDLKNDPVTHDIPVIILTSMGKRLGVSFSTEDLCSFLGIEPNAFLEMPADPARLLEMTERLLGANSREGQGTP
jgi:two-component system alkaline phosphatase synthesis response regulator PhoP